MATYVMTLTERISKGTGRVLNEWFITTDLDKGNLDVKAFALYLSKRDFDKSGPDEALVDLFKEVAKEVGWEIGHNENWITPDPDALPQEENPEHRNADCGPPFDEERNKHENLATA